MPPIPLSRTLFVISLLFCGAASSSAKTLKITSTPPGATVEFDGKVVGTTPYEQDFPLGYFQRPMTALQRRLEHPIRLRLTLAGYVTQEMVVTVGPKDWLDLHRRSHGSYWLFKSDEFHIELPPLPPTPAASAARMAQVKTSSECTDRCLEGIFVHRLPAELLDAEFGGFRNLFPGRAGDRERVGSGLFRRDVQATGVRRPDGSRRRV